MSKFHINKHGVPAPCKAKSGNCPLGGEGEHFNSEEEAQNFINNQAAAEHGLLPGVNNNSSAYSMMETDVEKGKFRDVEKEMIYHKSEDVEGAYNLIKDVREETTLDSIKEKRSQAWKERDKLRQGIYDDIYDNDKLGERVKKQENTINDLEGKIKKESEEIKEHNSGTCPKCGKGKMVTRSGRYGTFIACNNFPKCKHTHKEMKPNKKLVIDLENAKANHQIGVQNIEKEVSKREQNIPEVERLNERLEDLDKKYNVAKHIDEYENPVSRPGYPTKKGTITPIEQYYEERKIADDKIREQIGENKLVLNSGQMTNYSATLNEPLSVGKDGNINNLYIEDESNKGNVNKVVKIHEDGGSLELDNGKRMAMEYTSNWKKDRTKTPPQSWKFYTTNPDGEKYDGPKTITIFNRDSSD